LYVKAAAAGINSYLCMALTLSVAMCMPVRDVDPERFVRADSKTRACPFFGCCQAYLVGHKFACKFAKLASDGNAGAQTQART